MGVPQRFVTETYSMYLNCFAANKIPQLTELTPSVGPNSIYSEQVFDSPVKFVSKVYFDLSDELKDKWFRCMLIHFSQCLAVYLASEFFKKIAIFGVTKPVIDFAFYLSIIDRTYLIENYGLVQDSSNIAIKIPQRAFRDFFYLTVMITVRYTIFWTVGEIRVMEWIFGLLKSPSIPVVGYVLSSVESKFFWLHSIVQGW